MFALVIRSSWAVQDSIDLEDARMAVASLLTPGARDAATYGDQPVARAGFRPGFGGGNPGKVAASNTTTLTVQPFQLVLPAQRSSGGGAYLVTSDDVELISPLAVAAADQVYPRIDRIVVQQADQFYGDQDNTVQILLVVGTPAAAPQVPPVPSTPNNGPYVELARYTLPAKATDMTKVTITDSRGADLWTVCSGGVLPVPNAAQRNLMNPVAWPGMTVYNSGTKTVDVNTGPSTWANLMQTAITLTGTAAANVPVQIEGQLYRYQDDIWVWTAGALKRLTYVNGIADDWQAVESYATGFTYLTTTQKAGSRMVGPDMVQMCGVVHLSSGGGIDGSNAGVVMCRLYAGHRPYYTRYVPCATSIVNGYASGAGFLGITGTADADASHLAGQVRYYNGDGTHLPLWVSLQGTQFHFAATGL